MQLINRLLGEINPPPKALKNYIWRSIQIATKQGSSFVIFLIATLNIPAQEMGYYNYIIGIIFLLTLFTDFGITTATSKYVAQYNVSDPKKLKKVLYNSLVLMSAFLIPAILIILLLGKYFLDGATLRYLYISTPIILLAPLSSLYDGIYVGLKRFKVLAQSSVIGGVITILLSIPLITQFGITGALISQTILYLSFTIWLMLKYRDNLWELDKTITKNILSYSVKFGLATIGYFLFSRVNLLIMGYFGYFVEIAHYELLNKGFILLLLPFTILGQVIAPYMTEIFTRKRYNDVLESYKKIGVASILVTSILTVGAVFLLPYLITRFFPEYQMVYISALVLPVAITYAQQAFSAPINAGFIVSTGHAGIMSYLNLVAGAINLVLAIFLTQKLGYIGSVYSTLIVQTISLLITQIIFYRKLKVLS